MIKIKQAVITEGKYDKIKLKSVIDAVIITTDGFSVFKNKEKIEMIKTFAKTTGIVILTDSDSAGFKIRSFIKSVVNGCGGNIVNIYIPDIAGKEKRKKSPSKEGKIGVEGITPEVLKSAFESAGILTESAKPPYITKADLYADGLSGGENSAVMRSLLLRELGLPALLGANALVEVLNAIYTKEQYETALKKIKTTL